MEDKDKKVEDLNKDKKPGEGGNGDGGDNKDKKQDDAGFKQKLEGKDNGQLIEMYGNLERKVGEMSGEVKQKDELIKQMNIVLAAIEKDPTRSELVKNWIKELSGDDSDKKDVKKDDKGSDTRRAVESEIVRKFESRYGLDKLKGEDKAKAQTKLGNALWELADPKGEYKSYEELLDHIPLQKLDRLLENAYWVSNRDVISEKIQLEERAKKRENDMASIGGLSSASINEQGEVELTPDEIKTAQKMNIPVEKYKARKKEILMRKG